MKISLAAFAFVALALTTARAQVSLTGSGSYSQDFDVMGSAGITTPSGWFVGTGTGASVSGTAVTASTGSDVGASNYNYGSAGSNERALGSLASSTGGQRDTEVHFTNNTGLAITDFLIRYDGEQWRSGGTTQVANSLVLQYSSDGTAGSWVNLGSAFNFTSPQVGQASGALDGNASADRTANIGGTFAPSAGIANGQSFFLRWADADDTGTDAGIAVDNFSFAVVPEPATWMLMGVGLLVGVQRLRRRK
jgi:hypothetical protein